MAATLQMSGALTVGGDCSAACSGGGNSLTLRLGLRCSPSSYQTAVYTPSQIRVLTPGLPGQAFVDVDLLDQLTAIEFIYAKTDAPLVFRVGAAEPVLNGQNGIFPTLFAGGESFDLDFEGAPISVVFQAGDQTAAQVAARINSTFALAGYPTPRAEVLPTGQLAIRGVTTGAAAAIEVTAGTGAVQIGFPIGLRAVGAGADIPVYGTWLQEFPPYPSSPARIQVSGIGNFTVLAAGRSGP